MVLGPGTAVLVTGTSAKAVEEEAPGEESLPGALVVVPISAAGTLLEAKLYFAIHCSLDSDAGTGGAGTTGTTGSVWCS